MKVTKKVTNPIDLGQFLEFKNKLKIYTRITIVINEPSEFQGLRYFNEIFDIIAIQPNNDKALTMALTNLEPDIITFNYSTNLRFWLRNKAVHSGISKGLKFEIIYKNLFDPSSRLDFLSVAKHVIRASMSVGIILSSGATSAVHLKSRFDLINLLKLLNIRQNQLPTILGKAPVQVLLTARLRTFSYKQTVAITKDIFELEGSDPNKRKNISHFKRKADTQDPELKILKRLSS